MFAANETFVSAKNVQFVDQETPTKPVTVESFCLSQKPFTIQAFESLQEADKLKAFKSIIEVTFV